MQYALVNGIKSAPQKGIKGICIDCGTEMHAKCGNIKLHHWAHRANLSCDSWWETETEWHRNWKNCFPESFREVSFLDVLTQEYHRADIHTPSEITIEFQNSPLSTSELEARNNFYGKILWVVNGLKFKGFQLGKPMPDPNDPALIDFEFEGNIHLRFFRKSTAELITAFHPDIKSIKLSSQHYSFAWKHPHVAWYNSVAPTFIDFGGHFLYWLRKKQQDVISDFHYLQLVSKKEFIKHYTSKK